MATKRGSLGHKRQYSAKKNVNPTQVLYIAVVLLENTKKKALAEGCLSPDQMSPRTTFVVEDTEKQDPQHWYNVGLS